MSSIDRILHFDDDISQDIDKLKLFLSTKSMDFTNCKSLEAIFNQQRYINFNSENEENFSFIIQILKIIIPEFIINKANLTFLYKVSSLFTLSNSMCIGFENNFSRDSNEADFMVCIRRVVINGKIQVPLLLTYDWLPSYYNSLLDYWHKHVEIIQNIWFEFDSARDTQCIIFFCIDDNIDRQNIYKYTEDIISEMFSKQFTLKNIQSIIHNYGLQFSKLCQIGILESRESNLMCYEISNLNINSIITIIDDLFFLVPNYLKDLLLKILAKYDAVLALQFYECDSFLVTKKIGIEFPLNVLKTHDYRERIYDIEELIMLIKGYDKRKISFIKNWPGLSYVSMNNDSINLFLFKSISHLKFVLYSTGEIEVKMYYGFYV